MNVGTLDRFIVGYVVFGTLALVILAIWLWAERKGDDQ